MYIDIDIGWSTACIGGGTAAGLAAGGMGFFLGLPLFLFSGTTTVPSGMS